MTSRDEAESPSPSYAGQMPPPPSRVTELLKKDGWLTKKAKTRPTSKSQKPSGAMKGSVAQTRTPEAPPRKRLEKLPLT